MPLPELSVIGAAAEAPETDADNSAAKNASEKPLSARERLTSRTRTAKPRKKRGALIAAIMLLIVLLGLVGTALGGLAYLRWYANDDTLDFQGTWYVAGTETPIEISADAIRLTESVAYRYKLNTHDKTITLTLGNMTGHGSYRFSLDRNELVIFDGQTDPNTILESDVRWLVQALYDSLVDEPNDVTAGIRRNRTLLTREPNAMPIALTAPSSSGSNSSSNESDGPHTVWSADEWRNGGDTEGGNSSSASDADSAGTTHTTSDADDVDSLLQGINDLPISDTAASDNPDTSDQTAPESATP